MNIILISAMPEEVGNSIKKLKNLKEVKFGDLTIFSGKWYKNNTKKDAINISIAWSGWGKVSAARAITRLISYASRESRIDLIIFTGVAGAISEQLNQWDLVIAKSLVYYDFDASPFFETYVIPSLKSKQIKPNLDLIEWAYSSLSKTIKEKKIPYCQNIYKGLVCTGDQFISDKNKLSSFLKCFPETIAVEMEGAAISQVAAQEKIPSLVLRVISDSADDESSIDFSDFLNIYEKYAWKFIESLLNSMSDIPL